MKRHRTYAPPPGALEPLRNPRLYGRRETQIEGNALRSRGCPNPNRAAVYEDRPVPPAPARSRSSAASPQSPRAHARKVERAHARMSEAQAVVRDRKTRGLEYSDAVAQARTARAAWLALTGGAPERKTVVVATASDTNPVKAV